MNIETLLQLDPKVWPLAVMSFLRVLSIFIWLPILGETVVPMRLKVLFSIVFTFLLWPVIEGRLQVDKRFLEWDSAVLLFTTLREVFFGFAIGFAARSVVYAINIASQIVGVNMGFQAASLFNPMIGREETAFTTFQGWVLVVVMLSLNIHHIFLEGIANSFTSVPIGPVASAGAVSQMATHAVHELFELGIRIAAPLILIQALVTIALGLMNRAIPQLNVFIINFPVSFALSMAVLFFSAGSLVRFLSTSGAYMQVAEFEGMKRVFAGETKGQ